MMDYNESFNNPITEEGETEMKKIVNLDWLLNWRITSFKVMVDYVRSLNISKNNRKLLHSLCYSVLWFIWLERNERHFGKKVRKPLQLDDDIQLCTYSWVKNRGKMGNLAWAEWCCLPNLPN
ncbi:hypothetical protein LXL04_028747 [Taraxacum kok-saghyz]